MQTRPWDNAPTPIQQALVRGHRWLAMLESGVAKNLTEVAALEGMDRAHVSRMLNRTNNEPPTRHIEKLDMPLPTNDNDSHYHL